MPSPTNPQRRTLLELRTDVRSNLDEQVQAFWSDTQLNRFLTIAADTIWTEMRKLKADYWLIYRPSTAGLFPINGVNWDMAQMKILPNTSTLWLPPDHAELKTIYCLTPGYEHVTFRHCDMARPEFRYGVTMVPSQAPGEFLFDVIQEHMMIITPKSDTMLDIGIFYVPISCIVAGGSDYDTKTAFTLDTDEVVMPHPLYIAIEDLATWRAQMMDRDPSARQWYDAAQDLTRRWFGGHARQIQDPETVPGLFE